MSRMQVNGVDYDIPDGASVSVVNGVVLVNGSRTASVGSNRPVEINVYGNVEAVNADNGSVTVAGKVGGDVRTETGSVKCGDVAGSVKVGTGSVKCGAVGGSVGTTTGSIMRG